MKLWCPKTYSTKELQSNIKNNGYARSILATSLKNAYANSTQHTIKAHTVCGRRHFSPKSYLLILMTYPEVKK